MNKKKKIIKNTKDLFKSLKIPKNTLTTKQKKYLDENGYLIIKKSKFLSRSLYNLNKISSSLIKQEGDKGGWEGKEKLYKEGKRFDESAERLGGLIGKHLLFRKLILIPEVLAAAQHVIKGDIKVCGLNLRNPKKGLGKQNYHFDGYARNNNKDKYAGIVCFIYINESKLKNGATKVIPKSHKLLGYPDEYIQIDKPYSSEKIAEVDAGGIVIANLNLWHAGGQNFSGKSRKVIMLNIKRRDQGQLLNYKRYLDEDLKKQLSPEESYLLATRDMDKDQVAMSIGTNEAYHQFKKNKKITKLKSINI